MDRLLVALAIAVGIMAGGGIVALVAYGVLRFYDRRKGY